MEIRHSFQTKNKKIYIKFKDDYNVEGYVKYCNSRRKRSMLAEFLKAFCFLSLKLIDLKV